MKKDEETNYLRMIAQYSIYRQNQGIISWYMYFVKHWMLQYIWLYRARRASGVPRREYMERFSHHWDERFMYLMFIKGNRLDFQEMKSKGW